MGLPEVICLTESHFKNNEANLVKLDKYVLSDYFCRTEAKMGGVAIFIREDIEYKIRKFCVKKKEVIFEYASVDILLESKVVNVTCLYNPSTSNFEYFRTNLELLLDCFDKLELPIFICGDFNVNFDNKANRMSVQAKDLTSLFASFGLHRCFFEYSRIDGISKTIIDNVFSNIEARVLLPETIYCDLSDHFMQIVNYRHGIKTDTIKKYIYSRNFKNEYNIAKFIHIISNEDWNEIIHETNADDSFTIFFNRFKEIIDLAFPLEQKLVKNKSLDKKPWVSYELINEGNNLRDLFKIYKVSNNLNIKNRYLALKKKHKNSIAQAKTNYYNTQMESSNNRSATAWKIIKDQINSKERNRLPQTFSTDKGDKVELKEAASVFNDYFLNSIKQLTDNMTVQSNLDILNINNMFLLPITPNEVAGYIKDISHKDAKGFDGIPCSLLSHVANFIKIPLANVINLSFNEGVFPSILKQALLVPIHKKNETELISNYRAISLLSPFSKLYELAYAHQLKNFLNKHNILKENQFGFREKHSTQDAVLALYKFLLNNIEQKNKTACIYFDMTRAFDTVNHQLLLQKLESYGIRGAPLSWVASYLNERSQKVIIKDTNSSYYSDSKIVTTGVPQGSTLGPLLFIIFINDLASCFNEYFTSLFADDACVAVTANCVDDLAQKANDAAKRMQDYCTNNGLVLNASKTDLVSFSATDLNYSLLLRIDGQSIKDNNAVKFLGVQLDELLKWGDHIVYLSHRLETQSYVIWKLRNYVSLNILKIYYYAHVNSILNYCIVCWGNSNRLAELLILQKKIIRTILFKKITCSCRNLFKELEILTIPSMYILACAVLIKSNKLNAVRFTDRNISHDLRHTSNILLPQHNLSLVANSPFIMSIKIYNHLPCHLKQIDRLPLFKNKLKKLLLNHSFYSVEEYLTTTI